LLPGVRVTRCRVLALFAAGVLVANSVTLLKVAAALPLPASDPSTERRLKRFLTNPAVGLETLWQPLLPVLLRSLGQRELILVFDPTPYREDATILVVGVLCRHRVLPLVWRVMPQQVEWPQRLREVLPPLLATVAAAAPRARRVLPTPPGPVKVSSRTSSRRRSRTAATSCSRPTNGVIDNTPDESGGVNREIEEAEATGIGPAGAFCQRARSSLPRRLRAV
jgi:hypothetical protein